MKSVLFTRELAKLSKDEFDDISHLTNLHGEQKKIFIVCHCRGRYLGKMYNVAEC